MQKCSDSTAKFKVGNAYKLTDSSVDGDTRYDIITIRSMLYTLPSPEIVVKNCLCKLKKNGVLHILDEDYGITNVRKTMHLDSALFFESMRSAFRAKKCNPTMGRDLLELCRRCSKVSDMRTTGVIRLHSSSHRSSTNDIASFSPQELDMKTDVKITNMCITNEIEENKQLLHDMFLSWIPYASFIADNCDTELHGKHDLIVEHYKDVAVSCKKHFAIWGVLLASTTRL